MFLFVCFSLVLFFEIEPSHGTWVSIEHMGSNKPSCLNLSVGKGNNHATMCTMKQIWGSCEDTWSTLCEFLEKEGNVMTHILVPHSFQWWLKWQKELRADCLMALKWWAQSWLDLVCVKVSNLDQRIIHLNYSSTF